MTAVLFLVLAGVSCFVETSATPQCGDPESFPCMNGQCIFRYAWCDSVVDCSDGSDEDFCHGVSCLDNHFPCKNGQCIPVSGLCDDFVDCTDGSDEIYCEVHGLRLQTTSILQQSSSEIPPTLETTERVIAKAAEYFLDKMTNESGWGAFTPRAVVALSFADKLSPISEAKKELIRKHLNIQLMADLLKLEHNESLSSLSLYINALYAVCQDPRSFHGFDLVAALRSKTDGALNSRFAFPVALLTLCIADDIKRGDMSKLADMYSSSDRTGFRALVIMGLICIERKTSRSAKTYVDHFLSENDPVVTSADIYTKALFSQVANAAGHAFDSADLRRCQLPDGSFGDMLATYNAIPALLHSSLLDLRCNTSYDGASVGIQLKTGEGRNLIYSLWITSDTGIDTHSMIITFEGNTTFYDIMRVAAAKDPLYSFSYDQTNEGKKVYSLAGIPNDAETGKSWILYEGIVDNVIVNSLRHMDEKKLGIDKVFPGDKSHFVFWLTR